jgi:ankyrin repeat protein
MSHSDLLSACSDGDIIKLTNVLATHDPRDGLPFTEMLEKAASGGHSNVVQHLLTTNPSLTMIDDSVIRAAVYSGSTNTFKVLSTKMPIILNNEQERRGTPLSMALASRASLEFLSFLLSEGADPNIFGDDTISPLSWAAGLYETPDAVKLLLEHGAQVSGSSALAAAASRGRVETVKYLLEHGADPNDSGNRPLPFLALHSSVENNHREIVALLLEYGADPQIQDAEGQTVLMRAYQKGNEEILQLLGWKQ